MKFARLFGFSIAALMAGGASASIIPTLTGTSSSAGITTYSYDVQLDGMQNLITGNELCLADVAGLTGTPTAPAGWTAVDNLSGNCPIATGVTAPNNAPTVLYTYTAAASVSGPMDLGAFTLQSTIANVGTSNLAYGAIAQKKAPLSPAANQGEVNGPLAIPEPGSFALFGASLLGLGWLRRRESHK